MKTLCSKTLLVVTAIVAAHPAARALTITPIFDASITGDPNSAAIIASINAADTQLDNAFTNPISVSITFKEDQTIGLGQSSTYINSLSYAKYRADLQNNQILSTNDTQALASLPTGSANPVNGSANVTLTLPLLRAIGETALGTNGTTPDSTISLKTSLMNLSRTGAQDPSKYDLEQVALHEINEVLGAGGAGSQLGQAGTAVGPLDLFRYSANAVRSYSTAAASAYFSIDGGKTNLSDFNQTAGGDYADWGGSNPAPQVQDAFSDPGNQLNLSKNELTTLDVVGYNANVVPEPSSVVMAGVGCLGLIFLGRRKLRRA